MCLVGCSRNEKCLEQSLVQQLRGIVGDRNFEWNRGHLILTTPNARTLQAVPGGVRKWSDQPIEDVLSRGELTRLLSEHFEVISLQSFIFGIGQEGSYRLVNSHKVRRLMESVGLRPVWESVVGRFNYGLHFIAIARKREFSIGNKS